MIGYNYTLTDVGDGWNEGKVYLAFENISGEFVGGEDVDISGGIVETQEGKSYPTEWRSQAEFAGGPASGFDFFSGIPKIVPPHFRWTQVYLHGVGNTPEVFFLKFRSAVAAHPLRIVFPSRPDLNLDLASSQLSLAFPAESSILSSAKPISALAGKVLADDPAGLRVTLNGTGFYNVNGYLGLFLGYTVTNNDKLDSHKISVTSPFMAYFDQEGLVNTFLQEGGLNYETFSFEAGPGQSKTDVVQLGYREATLASTCNPGVYAPIKEGNQYVLYNLNVCK